MNNKILFISGNLYPAIAGDSIFSQGLIDRLFQNHHLDVCSYGSYQDLDHTSFIDKKQHFFLANRTALKAAKWERIFKLGSIKQVYSKELNLIVKEKLRQNEYSFIVVDHLRVYSLVKDMHDILKQKEIKLIYIAHNIEYLNLKENIKFEKNWFNKINLYLSNRKLKKLEFEILKKADITWTLSDEDKNYLKLIEPNGNYKVINPYFDWKTVKLIETLKTNTKKLMILGSMNWYPNVVGTLHFIDKIFKPLLEIDPDYKLYIVGQKPKKIIQNKKSDSIIVTGKVKSVDKYIKDCDLLVIPNRLGSGIKIKFLESISKGLPIVSYPENVVGYKSKLLKFPFVVKNEKEFINSIVKLISNYELKKQFIESFKFESTLNCNIFSTKS